MISHHFFCSRPGIPAIGPHSLYSGSIFQIAYPPYHKALVIRDIRCDLYFRDQLHFIFFVAGLGQIDHIPSALFPFLASKGCLKIIGRLHARGAQALPFLHLYLWAVSVPRIILQLKMLGEYPFEHLITFVLLVSRFQLFHQFMHQLAYGRKV
ncbi:hypothetical protein ES708_29192 [subsurface metagenome]